MQRLNKQSADCCSVSAKQQLNDLYHVGTATDKLITNSAYRYRGECLVKNRDQ